MIRYKVFFPVRADESRMTEAPMRILSEHAADDEGFVDPKTNIKFAWPKQGVAGIAVATVTCGS